MKKFKNIFGLPILALALLFGAQNQAKENRFEQFGDAFRLLPLYVAVVSYAIEDYEGIGQLALGTASTQLVSEGMKGIFNEMHNRGYNVSFAKRPGFDAWVGMPSGHAAGAFSAASFVYYRYGWKSALPVGALAILTAASRVDAKKHSVLQVSVGAAIAWGFGWLFTSEYRPKNALITPNIEVDKNGALSGGLNIALRF